MPAPLFSIPKIQNEGRRLCLEFSDGPPHQSPLLTLAGHRGGVVIPIFFERSLGFAVSSKVWSKTPPFVSIPPESVVWSGFLPLLPLAEIGGSWPVLQVIHGVPTGHNTSVP